LNDPVALFGRSRSGIDFNACDNAVVHFVILLVVPENQPNSHLQTLAVIARLFSQHAVREKMTEASTAGDLLRALEQCELELD
jgi:mannitol/fructose-specific phosphotransferase system IIA component (Ntr-type)